MAPCTGGCHYDEGCGKFENRCGACPQLGSRDENDLSRQVWQRKYDALRRHGKVHLVATSNWIAQQAKRSSLLRDFPITVIPNGLDTEDFAPRDFESQVFERALAAEGLGEVFEADHVGRVLSAQCSVLSIRMLSKWA